MVLATRLDGELTSFELLEQGQCVRVPAKRPQLLEQRVRGRPYRFGAHAGTPVGQSSERFDGGNLQSPGFAAMDTAHRPGLQTPRQLMARRVIDPQGDSLHLAAWIINQLPAQRIATLRIPVEIDQHQIDRAGACEFDGASRAGRDLYGMPATEQQSCHVGGRQRIVINDEQRGSIVGTVAGHCRINRAHAAAG